MKNDEQILLTRLRKIAELEKVVQQHAARIAALEKRLNKNSSNRSKPPPSEGLGKLSRMTSLREHGAYNSNDQKGSPGQIKQLTHIYDKIMGEL